MTKHIDHNMDKNHFHMTEKYFLKLEEEIIQIELIEFCNLET